MYLETGIDDEDELIARCLKGDPEAFQPLVERYYRPLFGVAARLLGNRDEAEDVTQTVFLKAYQALETCERGRRFFSWIYRILVNECLNVLRGRRPTEAIDEAIADPAAPVDAVDVDRTRAAVRHALVQLPAAQRDVIVLRHFAEMRYDQIAATLGIPEKTVKSRLFSARQRLSELLASVRS